MLISIYLLELWPRRNHEAKESQRKHSEEDCPDGHAGRNVASENAGQQDCLSEHGPVRVIPDGRTEYRNRPGAECGSGLHLTRCRGLGPRQAWLRNRG